MDTEVDSAWMCTQAIVNTDSQSDNEQGKINNYGYIVLNDMIDNERYILKEGDNTIGRHPLNHIYIEHPSVSMNHAVIQCDSDGVVLLDKGSLNKTKLNKKILKKDVAYFLEENALLVFGEVRADYFVNERSNDTEPMVPENTNVHKETQNDELSLSKSSNAVINLKSFRTDIPSSICKLEKKIPENVTGTECALNNINDLHIKLNSSSPSDEYLLEALSQVEAKQNNVNSNEIVHNLSNKDTLIMDQTESMPEITRVDTPSLVMNLENSILTIDDAMKNQFQSPNKINTEMIREDTPSPVMDLKSSFSITSNIPKNIFQSPSKINTELIREDTPSPIMDLGCYNYFENNLETDNHGIISAIHSPNKVDEFDNTQVLEIDNNIVELQTQTNTSIKHYSDIHSNDNLSGSENTNLNAKCSVESTEPFCRKNDDLTDDKHEKIVNTFEADDDDVFRHFIENECKSQQHDLEMLENQDFFNCSTQKISINKNINTKSKLTSSIHDKETQRPPEFKQLNKTNTITSNIYCTNIHKDLIQIPDIDTDFSNCPIQNISITKKIQPKVISSINDEETQKHTDLSKPIKNNACATKSIHENLTQIPKTDDDFFNCPTQKVSTNKNIFSKPKLSPSIHEEETQIPSELTQPNKTKTFTSKTYVHEDLTEVSDTDDDFFNCPTQKLSITKKINPQPKVSSLIHDAETQDLLEFLKPDKSNSIMSKSDSTSIHDENTQIPKIDDDDFFNCPTQKVSINKNIISKPKLSPLIHGEGTQIPSELTQPNKTKTITSKTYSTNIHADLTEVPDMDDDFFNCPTQKLSITKKINPQPKVSSSIHYAETQDLLEFSKPDKSNSIMSKSNSTSKHEENTQIPKTDDDFFNCPTQKVSINKNIFSIPKVSPSIHEEETQIPSELTQPNKTKTFTSKTYSTNIHADLTEVPDMDDDFFNCPTQKLSITKKINPQPKVSSSIHDAETQDLLEFSKPDKSNSIMSKNNSTSKHEENTQIPKTDDDFFNCPTQKLSITKKINPQPKVSSSINDAETQDILDFSKPDKSNSIMTKSDSTNIHADLTEVPDMDDDFFNCPTQKLSITKKINPQPKVSSSIHDAETQDLLEFSKPDKSNSIMTKSDSTSKHEENTQIPKIDDDDFFNCPTQKVSINKNIFSKPKLSPSIHEEETQIPSELTQPNKTKTFTSKTYSTNIRADLTEVPDMDDDFFNCPTQKLSITKKINPQPKVSSSIHDAETQDRLEFSKPDKSNSIMSKSDSTSIHEENTQIPKTDDDFFNCPTQKVSINKNIFSKPKLSPSIHEEETQIPSEPTQLNKTNTITSMTNSTNIHKVLTEVPGMDDDFFNCPTQKLSITKKINPQPKVSSSIHDAVTQDILEVLQPTKNNASASKSIHENLTDVLEINEDFFNCPTQKFSITKTSKTINPKLEVHVEETQELYYPKHVDESNNHKQTAEPDNEEKCNVQKSKCVKSDSISLSNVQLPVICNEKSSNSLRINKPKIRVREDLHIVSSSGVSSNNSTIILNKSNQNSVFNNINTTVHSNKNFDSPGCSKSITHKKNDLNSSSSTKRKHFTDDSLQSHVSTSLKYNHKIKQLNESIFSPLNIPDVSGNSLLEHHSSPKTTKNNLNALNCEPSTSSNNALEWKSFWHKKKVQRLQDKGKNDKQKSIKIIPENKERYQTRALTRKRKQNCDVESNKKICNRNKILEPLVENSSEVVVSFSYLKSRHLQEMKQFVEKTGGTVTDEITQCSVLVTDKIRCTMKILSAIARGCPIVNTNWLKHSYTVKNFQDVDDFIIVDKDAERKYMFQLKESLAKAKTKRLLDGYNVLVTPSVKPGPQEMKVIITCAGGNYVLNWTTTQYSKELIVTCDKDLTRWKSAWDNDSAKIIDCDTLVTSIIKQKLIM